MVIRLRLCMNIEYTPPTPQPPFRTPPCLSADNEDNSHPPPSRATLPNTTLSLSRKREKNSCPPPLPSPCPVVSRNFDETSPHPPFPTLRISFQPIRSSSSVPKITYQVYVNSPSVSPPRPFRHANHSWLLSPPHSHTIPFRVLINSPLPPPRFPTCHTIFQPTRWTPASWKASRASQTLLKRGAAPSDAASAPAQGAVRRTSISLSTTSTPSRSVKLRPRTAATVLSAPPPRCAESGWERASPPA